MLVVIELQEVDRSSPHANSLVKACSDAVAEGRCILAGSSGGDPTVGSLADAVTAVVSWTGRDQRVVGISVGRLRDSSSERDPNPHWLSRQIEFRDEDALAERWRSVGLVIAALVGEETHRRAAMTEATPPAPAPPPATTSETPNRRSTPPPSRAEFVWLDAGGIFNPGFGDTWARVGGAIRAAWRPSARLPLFLLLSGRYTTTPGIVSNDTFRLNWASVGVGVGGFFMIVQRNPGSLRFELTTDVLAERIRATATVGNAEDSQDRWIAGGRLGAAIVWSPAPIWAVVLGVDETIRSSGTVFRLQGDRRGREPAFDTNVVLGARAIFR